MAGAPMIKALILVGGPSTGTRFRPLGMDCPKPLFPVGGAPLLCVLLLFSSLSFVGFCEGEGQAAVAEGG